MELDLLLTLIGMGASVVAAAAIARYQIRQLEQQMSELRKAMQANELRLDRNDMTTSMTEQRLNVIAQMNSPENKERQARELEGLRRDVDHLEQTVKKSSYS
jgi:transcriptional antiterminator Rof (Rho-off)|tara:strand:+ start:689 stop:994 length:306 start_codon:yes stop_codon:yes gene_type:complete